LNQTGSIAAAMLTTTNAPVVANPAFLASLKPLLVIAGLGAVLSAPYLVFLFKRPRRAIFAWLGIRPFVRAIIFPVGTVLYGCVYEYVLANGPKVATVALIISYVVFVLCATYSDYTVTENLNRVIKEKEVLLDQELRKNEILRHINHVEKHVQQVIDLKSKRYLAIVQQLRDGQKVALNTEAVIASAARPDIQLGAIYRMIKDVVEAVFCERGDEIEYSIMQPEDDHLVFVAYSKKPRTMESTEYKTGRAFRKGSSYAAACAWGHEQMIIVPEISEELKKPKESRMYEITDQHDHATEKGSVISYPIFDKDLTHVFPDGLVSVVNVTWRRKDPLSANQGSQADKKCGFTCEARELYEYLFNSFACRIVLETRIELVKKMLSRRA